MDKQQKLMSKEEWEEQNRRTVQKLKREGKLPSFEEVQQFVGKVLRRARQNPSNALPPSKQ